jgi:hypothetical protein
MAGQGQVGDDIDHFQFDAGTLVAARGAGPYSASRLARLLSPDTAGRPLYAYVCPDENGPFNARLLQRGVEGRDLWAAVPCVPGSSSSSSSGGPAGTGAPPHGALRGAGGSSASGSSDANAGYRVARLLKAEVEGRPLYAADEPCCPAASESSASRSASSASSSSSSESSSSQSSSSGVLSLSRSASLGASRSSGSGRRMVTTACCPVPMPFDLLLTLTNVHGCACLDGVTFHLSGRGNPVSGWQVDGFVEGGASYHCDACVDPLIQCRIRPLFFCGALTNPTWFFLSLGADPHGVPEGGTCSVFNTDQPAISCSPFHWENTISVFPVGVGANCCTGQIRAIVTEFPLTP